MTVESNHVIALSWFSQQQQKWLSGWKLNNWTSVIHYSLGVSFNLFIIISSTYAS